MCFFFSWRMSWMELTFPISYLMIWFRISWIFTSRSKVFIFCFIHLFFVANFEVWASSLLSTSDEDSSFSDWEGKSGRVSSFFSSSKSLTSAVVVASSSVSFPKVLMEWFYVTNWSFIYFVIQDNNNFWPQMALCIRAGEIWIIITIL